MSSAHRIWWLAGMLTVGLLARFGLTDAQAAPPSATVFVLPDTPLAAFQNAKLPHSIDNDRGLLLGGIGSDLWHGPGDGADEFWMVTDRGPNGQLEVGDETRRTFPVPSFAPTILHVRATAGALQIVEALPILSASGKPLTGLPNLDKHDETPYDFAAKTALPLDPNGLDTEGLARTSQGDFWLCDEYAPSLVHVDRVGRVVKRYIPAELKYPATDYPLAPALPALFARRKGNRGFEGLTLSADGKTVFVVLQSPLSNPSKKAGNVSRNTRVLAFDVATEKVTAEYVYVLEEAAAFGGAKTTPGDMKLSGVVALSPSVLLVLERTDTLAKLYAADLSHATNLTGSAWDDAKTEPSLEALTDLGANKIKPLAKSLVLDLSRVAGCPDKIEGLAVVDRNTLAVACDNDFAVGDFDAKGNNKSTGAKSQLLVVRLSDPLPGAGK